MGGGSEEVNRRRERGEVRPFMRLFPMGCKGLKHSTTM